MVGISKYTTIPDLIIDIPIRNQVNCMIDRAGASILDYDVVRNIEELINDISRDFDGILHRHADVPIAPTVTSLTGTFQYTRGSTAVTIVLGAAMTELVRGDQIRPDNDENIRLVVASVTDNTHIVLENVYYGEISLDSATSLYVNSVPDEVEILCRHHCAWLMWSRRTAKEDNPLIDKEEDYQRDLELIRIGKFQFTLKGKTIRPIPTYTDTTVVKTFDDDSLEDYTP